MKYKNICFIVAMEAEAKPLIKAFCMEEDFSYAQGLPMRAWSIKLRELNIHLVINGQDEKSKLDLIGTQAATLNTHLAISHFEPDLMISAGTAGAFQEKGAQIGEVYLSYPYVMFHDRRVDIPGWKEMGVGRFSVVDVTRMVSKLNLKSGVVTTSNSLDMPEVDENMIRRNGGEIKDMEAAAVAWVSSLHQVPFFCIKAVTDWVDVPHATEEQFQQNLHLAVENLTKATVKVIGAINS
jgi:nucleoside phosphorylase